MLEIKLLLSLETVKSCFFLNHDVENKCVYKEKFWMEKGESV